MASEGLHEDRSALRPGTVDRHRAIVSLMEELEAVDWYDQRVDAAGDDALRAVLAHNRDEEKEHAAMTLEWIRRHDDTFDAALRTYLFTDAPITEVEAAVEAAGGIESDDAAEPGTGHAAMHHGSLGIGSLKGVATHE